ncbi:MAG: GAF domain-containing protein [Candidatus Pristimantibacillus sp.]
MKAEANRMLEQLAEQGGFDFYGIGELDADKRKLHWVWAKGSVSSRTLNMAQTRRTGLAGAAIRSGRLVVCDESIVHSEWGRMHDNDPVMLAERLQAAAAATVVCDGLVCGVLFVGYRTTHRINETEQETIRHLSLHIAKQLESGIEEE